MPETIPIFFRLLIGLAVTGLAAIAEAFDWLSRLPFGSHVPRGTAAAVVLFVLWVLSEWRRDVERRRVDDEHRASLQQEANEYGNMIARAMAVSVSDRFVRHFKQVAAWLKTWNQSLDAFTAADAAVLRELSIRAPGWNELAKSLAYGPSTAETLDWQVRYGLTTGEPYVVAIQQGTEWQFPRRKDISVQEELTERQSLAQSIAEWPVTRTRTARLGELEELKALGSRYLSAIATAAQIKRAKGCTQCWEYKFKR